jgi:signal transduction histidine kinase
MTGYDVFLSYNSIDQLAVEEIARRLVTEGIHPWLDRWNLIPGEPWQEHIESALKNCASCAVLIGPSGTGPWQNEEMRASIDKRVATPSVEGHRFRVIPVLLPGAKRDERSRLPTFLSATTWVEFQHSLDEENAFHRLVSGIRGVEPGPGPGLLPREGQVPYRGLQIFDVVDAPFFFGREALIEWLVEEIKSPHQASPQPVNRFLAIVGPSGSGKSSLARAGLVAALTRNALPGSDQWHVLICRPGVDPVESLAAGLCATASLGLSVLDVSRVVQELHRDKRFLHQIVRVALQNVAEELRLVLLVDQFEEIFTLCEQDNLRQAFLENLLYAATVVGGKTIVILTLRADFYGKCAVYPTLAASLSDHQVLVGPMARDELRRAVERPAHLVGAEFEAGLVETLLNDVENQPGGLPLLQHAMLELWSRRKGRKLAYSDYEAIGGIQGALNRRAETIYNHLTDSEKEICRRIFLRLTQPGEGTEDTKRRASLSELVPSGDEAKSVQAVIDKLVGAEARLLVVEKDELVTGHLFVEVAHEALIRGWPRLRAWIEEDRASLRVHRQLTSAVGEWDKNQRDESFVYRGLRLEEAQEWARTHAGDLNESERAFLDASQEASEQADRDRRAARLAAERQQRLELLEEIGTRMAEASRDPDDVLELMARASNDLSGADWTSIYRYDAESESFSQGVRLPRDGRVEKVATDDLPGGDELPATIAHSQLPVFVDEVEEGSEMYPFAARYGLRAFAGLPLTVAGAQGLHTTIGVLFVNFAAPHAFPDDEQEILLYLGNQAAVAIAFAQAQESALAKEQLAALGTATATLQHRLGNTINVILPAVMRLRYRVGHDADNQEILNTIERNALFAAEVIRRMQTPLRQEPFVRTNVNSLLHAAIAACVQDVDRFSLVRLTSNLPDLVTHQSGSAVIDEQKRISVTAHLDPSIPDTFGSIGQLIEVFRVLVENAIKAIYPASGSVEVSSSLTGDRLQRFIQVSVSDTGKGIGDKTRSRIFNEPVPRKEFGEGAGLGLWLSKIIVQSHQGAIQLQSTQVGKGSTFVVQLPVLNQPPPTSSAHPGSGRSPGEAM